MNDSMAREKALNPSESFIVQAPAGSGKTELLTQRYLCLLAHAEKSPEEIIAITFTRKAAAEMRSRILNALKLAENPEPPEEAHLKKTYTLAKAALARDNELHWQLQNNPNQLRILTIDALASSISAQMPILTGFGAQPNIAENAEPYYQEAVQRTIDSLNKKQEDPKLYTAIKTLLLHFGNSARFLETLLTPFLAQREQWLGHLVPYQHQPDFLKQELEANLARITEEKKEAVEAAFDESLLSEALGLAAQAGHEITASPWQMLATLLLTKTGTWRKTVDKRQGFINKEDKVQMRALLEELNEHDTLREALHALTQCPPTHYTEQQWEIIQALLQVLPRSAAELGIIFQKTGTIDFVELNLRALTALGEEEAPTDLALYFDYQIRHLLIDEFQDTSVMQFSLIEKLIAGWQPHEGRTLFLVGDPMQSIYRFRNAEVGLFLRAKTQGIGEIRLTSLALSCNFRSEAGLVDWTNRVFQKVFPNSADMASGAIPYSTVTPTKANSASITHHVLEDGTPETEADCVIRLIQEYQYKEPKKSIAVLVRSRSQLEALIPALHQAALPFQAVDIERLTEQTVIQDLLTLIRALSHLGDRLAWLSLLRAPYCGLTLSDLHQIATHRGEAPLWQTLHRFEALTDLSQDGKKRLARVIPVLQEALKQRGRLPLGAWLKGTWLSLGGPACVGEVTALTHADVFFKAVEEEEGDFSIPALERRLNTLYANPKSDAQSTLHIMTIHKAKGLEFDHVILPNLQRRSPYDASPVLTWWERPTPSGRNDLLLAPIKASHQKIDPLYAYLREAEREKSHYEIARLLYVAVTRAKASLHFVCSVSTDEGGLKKPVKGSFLNLLWSAENTALLAAATPTAIKPLDETTEEIALHRLSSTWKSPFSTSLVTEPHNKQPLPMSENTHERYLGTLMHAIFEQMGNEGFAHWGEERIQQATSRWELSLQQMGLSKKAAENLVALITKPLLSLKNKKKMQWLFSTEHKDARNEYALTGAFDGSLVSCVIDRSFVDSDGVRWIVDYKSSTPKEEPLEHFLSRQRELYEAQLTRYAKLFEKKEQRPIQLALYFPLAEAWCEWRYAA